MLLTITMSIMSIKYVIWFLCSLVCQIEVSVSYETVDRSVFRDSFKYDIPDSMTFWENFKKTSSCFPCFLSNLYFPLCAYLLWNYISNVMFIRYFISVIYIYIYILYIYIYIYIYIVQVIATYFCIFIKYKKQKELVKRYKGACKPCHHVSQHVATVCCTIFFLAKSNQNSWIFIHSLVDYLSRMSECEAAACFIIALMIDDDDKKTRVSTWKWISGREEEGMYDNLVQELLVEDTRT